MNVDADEAAKQRTYALTDAVDMTRRAASAVLAASCGERDASRTAVLVDANRRLWAVLNALQGLA